MTWLATAKALWSPPSDKASDGFVRMCAEDILHVCGGRRPESADDWLHGLSKIRKRRITRIMLPGATAAPFCILAADRYQDFIVQSREVMPGQKDALSGHEGAHLRLGHRPKQATPAERALLQELLPEDTDLTSISVHRRTNFASPNEFAAEVYATTLSALIAGKGRLLSDAPVTISPDTLHQLFGYGRGD